MSRCARDCHGSSRWSRTIAGSLREERLELTLPRFGIETATRLDVALEALGMPTAFDRREADFSGISPEWDTGGIGRLHIQAAVHQANIDVDEYGTEAAAATAVIIGFESEPPQFNVDRPFVFALRDRQTGAVLFFGRVTDPSLGR
jgi:serpin B